ncbi:unnamed protein product [Linum trigynum]|uniref:Uncharacterized protein n=1 Tax=Linum trigynum TaxID=586398 RepID=A0AAV2DAF1_9ROSI
MGLPSLGQIGEPGDHILERLDRCLGSTSTMTDWSDLKVIHLSDLGSDHRILLVQLIKQGHHRHTQFQFDGRWNSNDEALDIIRAAWAKPTCGSVQFRAFTQLKIARHDLVEWAKLGTSNSARQIRELKAAILDLREAEVVD